MVAFMTENLAQIIRQVGDPIARALGVEILDIQCTGKPTNPLVRLTLDKDGGVGIDDCEQFHQSLRRTWEVTQPSGPICRFEVSSPGTPSLRGVPRLPIASNTVLAAYEPFVDASSK